ncbi:short-chain dehydrogenase [Phaeosphaeria sp. MPI-PUGE-AT-0046c]|nr:short-chain dehydrogenase [Phaeosphaeria sp. MPI-PUGE-AT-0046c]
MAGSALLTGANGSAGLHAAGHLLKTYPELTTILTVRSTASNDVNTNNLRQITTDGFDKTFQVNVIATVAVVLRLLDSFSPDGGRINLISSVAHYRRKNSLSPYVADIPANLDELGTGVLRYGNSKLVLTTWTYALNKYLEQDPKYRYITAVEQNPGDFQDLRAFQNNTPWILAFLAKYVMTPLNFLLQRLVDPTWRKCSEAGVDMVELAVNPKYNNGERGHYTLLKRDQPDEIVRDDQAQERVWRQVAEWAGIGQGECRLEGLLV